jgi:hypothetical protein
MGAGKTTVMAEASDLLTEWGIVHAAIDLDTLGTAHLTGGDEVEYRNLHCVWNNYAAAGAKRLLLAAAVESRRELDRLVNAVGGGDVLVCRLTATLETMQQRIRVREPGKLQQSFVDRVAELERLLDLAQLEDFSVTNAGESVTAVALEMLRRAKWL